MTTAVALLSGISRVDLDDHATSICRFVREIKQETRPCRVHDRLSKTVDVNHAVHTDVLDCNQAVTIDNAATVLVREVVALVGNAFVNATDHLAAFVALRRAFSFPVHAALRPGKRPFFLAKEPGIRNRFAGGQSREGVQAHVNADLLGGFRQTFRLHLTGERHEPFPGAGTPDAAGLDCAVNLPMQNDHHVANLREGQAVAGQPETGLRVGETRCLVFLIL